MAASTQRRAIELRCGLTLFAALLLASTLGCIGATPLPTRIKTPAGPEVKQVDLSFLQAGRTERAEVAEKLSAVDTRVDSRKFFVGRWSSSTWGGWIFLCGYISCAGGAGRHWSDTNLLVEFEGDRVKKFELFPDHDLARQLALAAAADDPMDFTQPRELSLAQISGGPPAGQLCGTITLSKTYFDFHEGCGAKKPHDFRVPAASVLRVASPRGAPTDPNSTTQVIHFKDKVKAGTYGRRRQMAVQLGMPDLMVLLNFVAQPR